MLPADTHCPDFNPKRHGGDRDYARKILKASPPHVPCLPMNPVPGCCVPYSPKHLGTPVAIWLAQDHEGRCILYYDFCCECGRPAPAELLNPETVYPWTKDLRVLNAGHERGTVARELRFDRRQFDQHRKMPSESHYNSGADQGKEEYDTYEFSDAAKPRAIHREKTNLDGLLIKEILAGYNDAHHGGYNVRKKNLGITDQKYLFPTDKVRAAEDFAFQDVGLRVRFNRVRDTFEPRDQAEIADYAAGIRALVLADKSPVTPHREVYGDRPVGMDSPHIPRLLRPCQIPADEVKGLVKAYRRELSECLRKGYREQENDRADFTRLLWAEQQTGIEDWEDDRRFNQLVALDRILERPELGIALQDRSLLGELLDAGMVENRAKPRRIRHKLEKLAPVLSRFYRPDGDTAYNDHAETEEDKRSPSTIAEWIKRRSDDHSDDDRQARWLAHRVPAMHGWVTNGRGTPEYDPQAAGEVLGQVELIVAQPSKAFTLWREFTSVFGVHLNVFPSEYISRLLARLAFTWDYLPNMPDADVAAFLGERPTRKRRVTQYEHGFVCEESRCDLRLQILRWGLFSYSQSGRASVIPEKNDQRSSWISDDPNLPWNVEPAPKERRGETEAEKEIASRIARARATLFREISSRDSRPTLTDANM